MRGVLINAVPSQESSTDGVPVAGDRAGASFDPGLPWRRARSVALRPEPFGALVYHFGNRKLSFLKSKPLVAVVEALADHPSAAAALVACGVPEGQRGAYVKALADLARSQMIERRTPSPPTARELAAGPGDEAALEAHP